MSNEFVEIMDIPFLRTNKKDFVKQVFENYVQKERKCFIVTANPEMIMIAKANEAFSALLEQADFVIPDGIGVVIASKILKKPLENRVPGIEVMEEFLQLGNENKLKVFLLGAKETVVAKAAKMVQVRYPHVNIVGYHHGFFDSQDTAIASKISQYHPDFVFVALGSPKQEQWIQDHLPVFTKGIFMGVGGSFDVIAGEMKRAPILWQKLNLEWLYRLIQEPSRWRRLLVLPKFMLKINKYRKGNS
ncbi:WecB/TagA/CpsF family glycosyltransferase [Bacillus spongiae]|uniref:N-acetylglucosaminyldiphosphoundecaprenol N-acetyl-beta-D-mannosaminyltransferase n=1 Tax=Bacillus spongiae TaxID=2683610 RepID=A0ABU8HEK5_9BACI